MLVRRRPENVRVDLAGAGVRLLVTTMYGGQRKRIVLPPAIAAVAFGERPNTRATYYQCDVHVWQVCPRLLHA